MRPCNKREKTEKNKRIKKAEKITGPGIKKNLGSNFASTSDI